MNKFAIMAATGVAAIIAGYAFAQQTSTVDFAHVDANQDGVVTIDEAMGPYPTLTADLFARADADQNGSLDQAEFTNLTALVADAGLAASSRSSAPSTSESSSSSGDVSASVGVSASTDVSASVSN